MKNKSYKGGIPLAITGFLIGLLLNALGLFFNYYTGFTGPLFHFFHYSPLNIIIILSPFHLSILFALTGFIKGKLITLKRIKKGITQVGEAIIITDLNRLVQWVNNEFVNIHGYTLKEIKGKEITDILHGPLSNKQVGTRMLTKLLKGEAVVDELIVHHKNGAPIWISANIKPIVDKAGQMEGFIAINKNISKRKEKELRINALYKEISDYKFALDESSSVIIFDIEGKIIRANNNFCTRYAFEESKIIGRDYSLINTSMGDFSISKPIWNALREGLTWKGELITHMANEKVYWAYTTIVPILDTNGNPDHFLLIEKDITERKLLESKFKSNNHRLHMAMEIALLGSWEINIEGIITLSDELRTIIKEPLNSPIDLAYLFARIPPEEVEMIEKNLVSTRTKFQRNDMEFEFKVHGEIHYLTTTIIAQFNEDGEFTNIFGTVQDVTVNKITKFALIKSEKEKERAMQIALIGSWEIDLNGLLKLSNELKTLIQVPLEADIDLSYVFERMLPAEAMIMENNLISTRTTFQKNEMGFQYLIHGKIHYFTATNTAKFDREGNFTGLFGTVQDITAFKLIELALKKSEEEKAVILNNTQSIICIYEMDGTLIYINNAAENILGFTNAETKGLNIRSFTHTNDTGILDEYLGVINSKDKVSGKIHFITSTGEKRLCLYQNTIYANNGNAPYVIASAIDITDVVAAEL